MTRRLFLVKRIFPARDHNGRDTVADEVCHRPGLIDESVHAQQQRHPGHGNFVHRRQRRGQGHKASTGNARQALDVSTSTPSTKS